MTLFQSMAPEVIAQSLAQDRFNSDGARLEEMALNARYYDGASSGQWGLIVNDLIRHPGERDDSYNDRIARFAHHNYIRPLANEYINPVASGEIRYEIPGATTRQSDELSRILSYNDMRSIQVQCATSQVLKGGGFIYPSWVEFDKNICFHSVLPENMEVETNPNNGSQIAATYERRTIIPANGREVNIYMVWVAPGVDSSSNERYQRGWGHLFSEDGHVLREMGDSGQFDPNPYGILPVSYIRGVLSASAGEFYGKPAISDAVAQNKMFNNYRSDLQRTLKMQGWAMPVFIGANEPEKVVSQETFVDIEDPSGNFKYESPDAPIAETLEAGERAKEMMAETIGLPRDSIRGEVPESGFALIVKYATKAAMCGLLRTNYKYGWRQVIRITCAIGREHNLDLPDPSEMHGAKEPLVDFKEPVIPEDREHAKVNDLADVEAGLMAPTDYVIKYNKNIHTEDAALAYLEKVGNQLESIGMKGSTPEFRSLLAEVGADPDVTGGEVADDPAGDS